MAKLLGRAAKGFAGVDRGLSGTEEPFAGADLL
jgi:hypothetical protein